MSYKRSSRMEAVKKALRQRMDLDIATTQPIAVVDAAHRMGLQVWFRDAKSYDGYYSPGAPPIIVLSSLRPLGRTYFTCAHEIGHHVYEHGAQLEETIEHGRDNDEQERIANTFAAHFLMPRQLIQYALHTRGLEPRSLKPKDVFAIISWLGVGYSALLSHIHYQLKLIGEGDKQALIKQQPKSIKQDLVGTPVGKADVIFIDRNWRQRSIDCRVGDYICSELEMSRSKDYLREVSRTAHGYVYQAEVVGQDLCDTGEGQLEARIWRRGRTMRAIYMYDEEDPDD